MRSCCYDHLTCTLHPSRTSVCHGRDASAIVVSRGYVFPCPCAAVVPPLFLPLPMLSFTTATAATAGIAFVAALCL